MELNHRYKYCFIGVPVGVPTDDSPAPGRRVLVAVVSWLYTHWAIDWKDMRCDIARVNSDEELSAVASDIENGLMNMCPRISGDATTKQR